MILSAGLSPAWQHVMLLENLRPGAVNRAKQVSWCASGKVLNVAVALRLLDADSKAVTLVGGDSGEAIKNDCAALGLDAVWVETDSPTRVCTSLVDTSAKSATELVENAGEVSAAEVEHFIEACAHEAATSDTVVFTGSLPVGAPPNLCRDLMASSDANFILDIRGPELLEALASEPLVVKPNRDELSSTLGCETSSQEDLIESMRLLNRRGARWVVITQGDQPVFATSASDVYRIQPPRTRVVSPIGCGDCMAAGLAWALDTGQDFAEALRFSVACAVAKLSHPLPGRFDPGVAKQLLPTIQLQKL